jgi:hypothetical protein
MTQRKPFVTLPEAADLLGIHRNTALYRAKTYGHLNGVRVVEATPTRLVISRAALERAIAGETDAPAPAALPWDGTAL